MSQQDAASGVIAGTLPQPVAVRRWWQSRPGGAGLRSVALATPSLVWIAIFLAGPLFLLGRISFEGYVSGQGILETWQLDNYRRVLTDSLFLRVIGNTMILGGWVTLLCAVLSFPLAITLQRARGVARAALYFAIVVPLLTSAVTKTFGWTILLSNHGVINQMLTGSGLTDSPVKLMYTMTGAVLALTQVLLPFMTLAVAAALENIDPALYEAARNLGARSARIFFQITLPLSMPGLVSGSVLVFTLAVSAYVTPRLVGGPTVKVVSVLIYEQAMTLLNLPLGSALSFLLLLIVMALFLASLRLTRGRGAA
jgi:putative spermidine/putrescine transport system permease protein